MTSAPKSLRTVVAAGPAIQLARSTTCRSWSSGVLSVMALPVGWNLNKGLVAGDVGADEQGLDRVGALVGVNRFDVAQVASDVEVEHNAVPSQDVARFGES